MTAAAYPTGEFLPYQAEDGHTVVECRFVEDNLWLTQARMAEDALLRSRETIT